MITGRGDTSSKKFFFDGNLFGISFELSACNVEIISWKISMSFAFC